MNPNEIASRVVWRNSQHLLQQRAWWLDAVLVVACSCAAGIVIGLAMGWLVG